MTQLDQQRLNATVNGDERKVRRFIESGADVNATDQQGWSPLHHATIQGHAGVVHLLIAGGGRPDIKDRGGLASLHFAAIHDRAELTQSLLAAGATVDAKGWSGWNQQTPEEMGRQAGHCVVVNLLRTAARRNGAAALAGTARSTRRPARRRGL